MKTVLVFLALLGFGLAAPKPEGLAKPKIDPKSLLDDFLDFVALIPLNEIIEIVQQHLENDGGFVAVVNYLQGDEWAALVAEVQSKPAVQDFIQYLTDAGLPVDELLTYAHDLIANAVPGTEPDENGSLKPLLDEIIAILPIDDLVALWDDKVQNSPDFQDLYIRISSEDARALVEEVRAIPEVQRLAQRLRDLGVDVDGILAFVYNLFGWGDPNAKKSPRSLLDDLLAFLALIDLDKIKAIADDHLANDGATVAVVLYLQGDEWAALVDEVGSKPAVQDFIQYLTDAGLPVDAIIGWIHDLIANAVPGTDPDETGSLRPLLDDVEAILPIDDILALLNDKLQNSPDFQDLYIRISSEDAKDLVEEVRAIDEVQRLAERLRDFGVRVDEALAWVYSFFGWGDPNAKKSSRIF